jgi:hypothetical protein
MARSRKYFYVEERIFFTITEEVTLIHQRGLSDETHTKVTETFGESLTAEIIMAVITINA